MISNHYASDIPIFCSSVPLSLAVGGAFAVLSDVLSAPRFLVDVFSFVVHVEFQVGFSLQRNFGGKNLTRRGIAATCCAAVVCHLYGKLLVIHRS